MLAAAVGGCSDAIVNAAPDGEAAAQMKATQAKVATAVMCSTLT